MVVASSGAAAPFARALLALFCNSLRLGLIDRVVAVGIGRVENALHPFGHFVEGHEAVPVLVETHDPCHKGRAPIAARRSHFIPGQRPIIILVEGQKGRGSVTDLLCRQCTVLIGVERLHDEAGVGTPVSTVVSALRAVSLAFCERDIHGHTESEHGKGQSKSFHGLIPFRQWLVMSRRITAGAGRVLHHFLAGSSFADRMPPGSPDHGHLTSAEMHDTHTMAGLFAGVGTSLMFTLTAVFFTAASRRLGSTIVNAARIFMAVGFLALTHRVLGGTWIPQGEMRQIVLLAISGIIGLAIGDHCLFVAFVEIGPRLATLIMTTAPLFAALFGWIVLGEALSAMSCVGIVFTLCGVAWVVNERQPGVVARPQHFTRGLILATLGAACQAGGLLLSKQGMGHGWLPADQHLTPAAATLVRMVFAGAGAVPMVLWRLRRARRDLPRESASFTTPAITFGQAWWCVTLGAIAGPFLGVWMSLVASDRVPLGVAQTLCSLVPIFILPFAVVLYRERLTGRAVVGAIIAVSGAAILFLA